MRVLSTLLLTLIVFTSCKSKKSFSVTEISCEDDAIVMPVYNSDSVIIYIPYIFKVRNNSSSKIESINIQSLLSNKVKDNYLFKVNDSLYSFFSNEYDNVEGLGSKEFQIYFKKNIDKKNIDSKYWLQKDSLITLAELQNAEFNRIKFNSPLFNRLKSDFETDSVCITANFKDFMVYKVWKLGGTEFKTVTSDDILNNKLSIYENIWKPE